MLEKYGFRTIWHLTDVSNVASIINIGLLSRNNVIQKGIDFSAVGFEKILSNRKESFQKMVLAFVTPHNKFISQRPVNHSLFHPDSRGLVLLEIDLLMSIAGRESKCFISNGNLATRHPEPQIGGLVDFADILDWHAILDRKGAGRAHEFGAQAEVLIPNMISSQCIRRVWAQNQKVRNELRSLQLRVQVCDASGFFQNQSRIPDPAIHNFQNYSRLNPSKIWHEKFGRGETLFNLGGRCVARFEDSGLQLIRFGSYDWL